MKKFFGRDKPKPTKVTPASSNRDLAAGIDETSSQYGHHQPTAVHQPHPARARDAPRPFARSSTDDHWEVVATYDDPSNPQHIPTSYPHQQIPPPPPLLPSRSSSLASLPPGASPPMPASGPIAPRSSSPFSIASNNTSTYGGRTQRPERETARKKSPPAPTGVAALGILRALEPHPETMLHPPDQSEDSHHLDVPMKMEKEKKEKKGFWDRGVLWDREKEREKDREKERDKDRERERIREDEGSPAELTRMIGYLTATASEDWSLVLEVCDRASANESNAKEAVKALRREFKYAEPSAQLSAARLWAIMLRNASDMFLYQISSRKFVDTLEDVLTSSRTAPVVRERLMEVLAAAAFISSSRGKDRDKDGFRHLWRRLKPADKPDEGIPFDTEDAMFSPPIMRPSSQYSVDTPVYPAQTYPQDLVVSPPILERSLTMPQRRRSPRLKHKIIPLEEDIRRLFQECKIGQGNANLLSEALAFAKPEDLEKDLIREFYVKCRASQELIYAQVPWASAGAERSRAERSQLIHGRTRTPPALGTIPSPGSDDSPVESTVEEDLLAALLAANESLLEALRVYDDLERIAMERATEERSRREVRLDRRQQHQLLNGDYLIQQQSHSSYGGSSRTPSPSPPSPPASPERFDIPSIYPSQGHPLPRLPPNLSPKLSTLSPHGYPSSPPIPQLGTPTQLLAPPPPAPHGPRSPAQASTQSRTPSPERISSRPSRKNSSDSDKGDYLSGLERLQIHDEYYPLEEEEEDDVKTPIRPSAKALGKRKVIEEPEDTFDPSGFPYEHQQEPYRRDTVVDSDSDDGSAAPWNHHVHYVYDAAAERTAQRLKDGRVSVLVNGVH